MKHLRGQNSLSPLVIATAKLSFCFGSLPRLTQKQLFWAKSAFFGLLSKSKPMDLSF
jgi:hypothetical protein